MRKYFLLLAIVAPLIFVGCSSDSDDLPSPVEEVKEYSVTIHNRINKSAVSGKSDGTLYDVNIVSQNGQIYSVGNIGNGSSKVYKLPSGYDKTKVIFFIVKFGKNPTEATNNYYWTPEESYGKMICLKVYDDRETEINFTEDTTYSSFSCKNIYDFKNMLQSILAKIGQ